MQALLNRDHEIVGFQVAQFQVGVPRDPEEVVTLHGHAWEQQANVEGHHLFQGNGFVDGCVIGRDEICGELHKSGQHFLRHFHPGQLALPAVGVNHQRRHVEAQVADERKGVRRVNG